MMFDSYAQGVDVSFVLCAVVHVLTSAFLIVYCAGIFVCAVQLCTFILNCRGRPHSTSVYSVHACSNKKD